MSSIVKFQLPPIKGTEVFPETIKSPPVIHASVDFLVDVEDPVAPEVLEDRAKNTLAENVGVISHFVHSQRQNFNFGIADYAKASRSYPGFDVSYTNIQNRQEIVTLKMYIDVRRQKRLEEEGEDELCVVVFHDGNQISYAPMTELNNPVGTATRQILNQSNWGSDIIKTSQLKFSSDYSAIYSVFNGLTTGTIVAGTSFAITSSWLVDERLTVSDTRVEYPILSGNANRVFVSSADVQFNADGSIEDFAEFGLPPEAGLSKPAAFYISPDGTRYFGFYDSQPYGLLPAISFDGTSYAGEVYFVIDNSNPYSQEAVLHSSDGPTASLEFYYVNGAWKLANFSGENSSSGDGIFYYRADFRENFTTEGVILGYSPYLGGSTSLNNVSEFSIPYNYGRRGYFLYELIPNEGLRLEAASTITFNLGRYNYEGYTYRANNPDLIIDLPPADGVSIIQFPYATAPENWSTVFYNVNYFGLEPTGPKICELITEYGSLFSSWTPDPVSTSPSYPNELYTIYRGWMHVSNGQHLIQAFVFDNQRYMYFNRGQITSLLGVPVDSIQTVLFDIPLSKIEQFN